MQLVVLPVPFRSAGLMSDRLGRAFPLVLGAVMFAACLGAMAVLSIKTVVDAYVMSIAIGVANGVMFTSVYSAFTDRFSDTTATAYGTKVISWVSTWRCQLFGSPQRATDSLRVSLPAAPPPKKNPKRQPPPPPPHSRSPDAHRRLPYAAAP